MPTTRLAETAQLLSTKLFVPTRDATLVTRPRLVARIDQGTKRALTVVTAPAGFGKTTLLTEWLALRDGSAGWLSLDARDNDPTLFWAYFIAAFERLSPDVGRLALSLLFSPHPPAIESVLSALINDIAAEGTDFVLLLDDYHVVENDGIHEGMSFFLEHMPPHMHLVLASRSEPPFPVGRLRGRGRLLELTPEDLRFTSDEAAAFLSDVMGLHIAPPAVAALEQRTEGWIAGLQLAALSMQGRDDVATFVDSFSGGHRHVADFLTEEVLLRQPPALRGFLLRTSVLQRMCGPLCDAVTGQTGSHRILEDLGRSNLFIVHLDDSREWYRFHHLFADVLRGRLTHEDPALVSELHVRASAWYDENGFFAEAIHHALEARDICRAADLVERSWRTMDRRFQSATWMTWVEALPAEILAPRPVLSVGYGWALLDAGRIDEGEVYLDQAEAWLAPRTDSTGMTVSDEAEFRSLPGTLAAARAYVAQARGDMEATERFARQALELLPEDDPFYRGIPTVTVGLAQWARGELEEARASFADAVRSFRASGNAVYTLTAEYAVADLLRQQGRLTEAVRTFERALRLDDPLGDKKAYAHRGLAEVLLERGETQAAQIHLEQARAGGGEGSDFRWCMAMADLEEARGNPDGALDWLAEAQRRHAPGPIPDTRPVAARTARTLIALGRFTEAQAWADAHALSVHSEAGFLREYELITLVQLLLSRKESAGTGGDDVASLLDRLRTAAEAGGRVGRLIRILLLQTHLQALRGDDVAVRTHLDRALSLAEPEGYYRVFFQAPGGLQPWLHDAVVRGAHRALAGRVHAAMAALEEQGPPARRGLDTPLTRRESEVLALVAAGLKNQDLAKQLFISVSTAKRHIANIYLKLDVTHRTEAVAKATELGLL